MKLLVVLAAAAALAASCASASHHEGVSSGTSSQYRAEDNYGNYQFGYDEAHATGASGRREERLNGIVRGSYNLADADGRQRTVSYVADDAGFRATIHTNEPGVDSARDPADVLLNKEAARESYAAAEQAPLLAALEPVEAPHLRAPLPPAPVAFRAPVFAAAAKGYAAGSAQVYTDVQEAHVEEAPTQRAFSYAFGAHHPSLSYSPPPAPVYAARVFQHGLKY